MKLEICLIIALVGIFVAVEAAPQNSDKECDESWRSSANGNGCEKYGKNKWCKKDGDHYGDNWKWIWGNFRLWTDDQGRTALVCPQCGCVPAGCPTNKYLDVQLILDSSNSVKKPTWDKMIKFLKSGFIERIFTAKDSRLAITRYGTKVELLQPLQSNVQSSLFDDKKYAHKKMRYTHTAEAMIKSFESFDKHARWNDENVIKALIVVTDGKANDNDLTIKEAADKWNQKGVKIFALGLGDNVDADQLKEISESFAVKVENLEMMKKVFSQVIPYLCY